MGRNGYNGTGIGAGTDQMMLLLDDSVFYVAGQYNSYNHAGDNNEYAKSDLKKKMEAYLTGIENGQDKAMTDLLADMTLVGGQAYSDKNPYCEGVAGASVTSKIRPLTTQEAKILTNFDIDYADAVTNASVYWWLASPGNTDKYAAAVTNSGNIGENNVGFNIYMRPALLLNLKSVTSTSKISDGVYELVVAGGDADFDAAPVYVRGFVYVDGKLINEGTDYNWVDGKLVLTDEFIKTLSEGTHKVAVLYTSVYGDTLPADFEYTAANSYDFTV